MSHMNANPLAVLAASLLLSFAATQSTAQPAGRAGQGKSPVINIAAESEALQAADPDAATAAAIKLGKTKDPKALDALLSALALGIEPRAAAAALESVAEHADPRAYVTARFYLSYRDPRVRAAAVRAVAALDDPRVTGDVMVALTDSDKTVRAAAIGMVAENNLRSAIEPLLELLEKGDEATAPALARLANPDVTRALGELIGIAPDFLIARSLGLILERPDFEPEAARVQVVRALGKVPGNDAVEQLSRYIQSIPEKPPRQSRREAEAIVRSRLSGGTQ